MSMSELQTGQQEIFDYVKNNLGDGMIDVELDPKHYQTALERSINRYQTEIVECRGRIICFP
jgi:hypothetical protein